MGLRRWFHQIFCTSGDPYKTEYPVSRWRILLLHPKYIFHITILIGLTIIIFSSLVNEQMSMTSFVDRVSASFKVRVQTENFPVLGADKCNRSYNSRNNFSSSSIGSLTSNSTSNQTSNSTGNPVRDHCRRGVEGLPQGIVVPTTDLQFRSLYPQDERKVQKWMTKNLLAMAVGIKQKAVVNNIVEKFPLKDFTVMLFHYDGVVDQWHDLPWSNESIHIVALHQTKWWYAKRFMHPDIVAQYNYIFLWDEDLGVEHFHADKYVEIMMAEGLEISQPALDPASHEIHHRITRRHPHVKAHKSVTSKSCTGKSKGVPCTGYVEVMAPVFSRAAWQCVWYMIQNDLVHGWGIDFKIGYCAQGPRTEKVGVIDAEYILHKGIPSLGGPHVKKKGADFRTQVRRRSSQEMLSFQRRWEQAARNDSTWEDPYKTFAASEKYQSSSMLKDPSRFPS